jgi:hypothetical protein
MTTAYYEAGLAARPQLRWVNLALVLFAVFALGATSVKSLEHPNSQQNQAKYAHDLPRIDPVDGTYWQD